MGDVQEESVRDNFVIVYELLDEFMDYGYPQTTDSRILKEYITQESHLLELTPRPPMVCLRLFSHLIDLTNRSNFICADCIDPRG